MREKPPWTLPLGRWGDAPVRLHLFFALAVACTIYLSWLAGQLQEVANPLALAAIATSVLIISAALHTAGHVYAAAQMQIRPDSWIIGPLGDFASVNRLRDPRTQLSISLAGPAVNLLVALACLPGVIASNQAEVVALLNPWCPTALASGPMWLVILKITLWINWTLAIVNLLPARPFDGGPIAHALGHLLYPRASMRRIELFMERLGILTGLALLVFAVLGRNAMAGNLVPPWFSLLLVGLLILFSSQRKAKKPPSLGKREEELFGYDFSQGYTSLERSDARIDEPEDENGPLERWLDTRREARRQRQAQLEAEEEQQVDEILARVHQHGLEGVTEEERMILQRVSMRYRTRLDQH